MAIDDYRLAPETGNIRNRWTVNAAPCTLRRAMPPSYLYMGIEKTVNVEYGNPMWIGAFVEQCPETVPIAAKSIGFSRQV